MKRTGNKGFTLVELIIVITILAILASIAFVQFAGYAGQARDSKKTSELANLRDKIEVGIAANSQDVTSFVDNSTSLAISPIAFAGSGSFAGTYVAGDFNYPAIGADATKYTFAYLAAAIKNTGGSFYQLAVKLEDDSTYTVGNYVARNAANSNNSITAVDKGNSTLSLTGSNIGTFRVGDAIGTGAIISKISSDLSTITYTGTSGLTNTGSIALTNAEDDILISGY